MTVGLINLINLAFEVFSFLILVEVIGSWILAARVRLPDWGFNILRAVHTITEPVLAPLRRLLPNLGGWISRRSSRWWGWISCGG